LKIDHEYLCGLEVSVGVNGASIDFLGYSIWDSENDDRNWIPNDHSMPEEYAEDEEEMREPLKSLLYREMLSICASTTIIEKTINKDIADETKES
jgi:hypothetical protein